MKRNWVVIWLGSLALAVFLVVLWGKLAADSDRSALAHELDLARAEGMPTTWQEYAASIEHAQPSENAAPLYRKLKGQPRDKTDLSALESELLLRPSPKVKSDVSRELLFQKETLAIVDRASTLPKCWFDRDWSKGLATLMPEFAYMKSGAKLVALRGALASMEGQPTEAVRNVQEMFRIARQAGQEGSNISTLVEHSIYLIGIRNLEMWSFIHRNEGAYRVALVSALKAWPKVDLQRMRRSDLLEIRDVLELSTTARGRADLGLKEEYVSKSENFVPLFLSRPKANITIAKSMRQIWEAYGQPPANRSGSMTAAWNKLMPALLAYPTGGDIYMKLSDSGDSEDSERFYDQILESRHVTHLAMARALNGTSIPTSVKTDDLRSPFDGKPVDYRFDGRQITIEVSCPKKSVNLTPFRIPTDNELSPRKKTHE